MLGAILITMTANHPAAPRFQLGMELRNARERAGVSVTQVAKKLRLSVDTIRRYERGDVSVKYTDLLVLLQMYGVTDPQEVAVLEELRDQGDQPLWWSKYGVTEMTRLLGFEAMATSIRGFERSFIPGLLQTEDYARALIRSVEPHNSDEQVEKQVAVRLERQARIFDQAKPPSFSVIIDEDVLRRPVGDPSVMKNQLMCLLDNPRRCELAVVPRSVGIHPGTLGSFSVYEFPVRLRRAAVYADGPMRSVYGDDAEDVAQARLRLEQIGALALNNADSRKVINSTLKELEG